MQVPVHINGKTKELILSFREYGRILCFYFGTVKMKYIKMNAFMRDFIFAKKVIVLDKDVYFRSYCILGDLSDLD